MEDNKDNIMDNIMDDNVIEENEDNKYVILITNDNKEYKVLLNHIKKSETLQDMINNIGLENNNIPIPNVNSEILEKIIFYLEYSNNNKLSGTEKMNKEIELLDIDDDTLFNLILGCNFLQINDLLDIGCKHVADIIKKCKNPEEIRKRFNIKNDFTPEEEEEILRENSWLNND